MQATSSTELNHPIKEMKMSQEERQSQLREKTRQLLQGPLKHVRVIGLAAALLPVGAVTADAAPNTPCDPFSGGTFCGFIWQDDGDGIQQPGEPAIEGASLLIDGVLVGVTNPDGFYQLNLPPGEYDLTVSIPPGTVPAPANQGGNDAIDSDGVADGEFSVVHIVVPPLDDQGNVTPVVNTDFGFVLASQVGTGTPGYWMNHDGWPLSSVTFGGQTFTVSQAQALMKSPDNKDKRLTMFSSLVAAMLNVANGTNASCISGTITQAQAWLNYYWALGNKVAASSAAWRVGEPMHREMDNYNNGMLCAPHRD